MPRKPSSEPKPDPLARWNELARSQSDDSPRLPISVLIGEAIELAYFLEARWEPVVGSEKEGTLPTPGMKSALAAGTIASTLLEDLRELAHAVGQAQAEFQACTPPTFVAPVERGKELLSELRDCLAFVFDDGVSDARDAGLARLSESHTDTSTHDGLALSLEGFSLFAYEHRERLAQLPEFDPGVFDEALNVAQRLRLQSALQLHNHTRSRRRDALSTRNRLAQLLLTRTNEARRAARFVFRHHPEIAALCASPYGRQRQARSRARRAKKGTTPEQPPTEGGNDTAAS